jgi:hypothetical protein
MSDNYNPLPKEGIEDLTEKKQVIEGSGGYQLQMVEVIMR